MKKTYRQINDKYLIDENDILGRGAFGIVYKGFNTENKRELAIKTYKLYVINKDPIFKNCIVNELNILNKIKHQNIVKLCDVIKDDEYLYIIEENCSDGTLQDYIHKKQNFNEEEIKNITIQLLQGFYLKKKKL